MRKLITYFLILALFLTTIPVQIFAQDTGESSVMRFRSKKHGILEYKPAMSFEYEYYEVGKISPWTYVEKLEQDLLNYEESWDPQTVPPVSRTQEGKPEHLRQSYNDFLYYNIYPEESPLWSYTGLVAGNGTSEVDVLRILDYHRTLSEEVAELFAENPEYKKVKLEKQINMIPVYVVLLAMAYVSWSIVPEALSVTIPCTSIVVTIPKWASFIALMAADILLTDEVAWGMEKLNEHLFQIVDSYKSSTIEILYREVKFIESPYRNLTNKPDGTDLMKPVIETEMENIERLLKEKYPRTKWYDPLASGDGQLLKKYFKYGYRGIDSVFRPRLKKILGEFFYDLFEGDEELINEYFRKEMLRTYYALEFIRDELNNTDDPLRYERAMIDLATTYKVQNIQIVDGRVRKIRATPEVRSFGENLQRLKGNNCSLSGTDRDFVEYINAETEALLGAELADQTSVMTTYPTMLTRAEVNYLVQLIDMHQKKKEADDKILQERARQSLLERYTKPDINTNYPVKKTGNKQDNMLNKVHGEYYNFSSTK